MIWRVDIHPKIKSVNFPLLSNIRGLGMVKECQVLTHKVYFLDSALPIEKIKDIAEKLLVDPLLEVFTISQKMFVSALEDNQIIITSNPGVCDPVALSLSKAIADLAYEVSYVKTARFYQFDGLTRKEIEFVAEKLLYNPLIEHLIRYEAVVNLKSLDEFTGKDYKFHLKTVEIIKADPNQLEKISAQGCLSLSLDEMKIVQDYFVSLKRNPTDCELETIAVSWSEHCAHKTFRGLIEYEEKDQDGKIVHQETINSLLKTTVMKATKEINSLECVSVFDDNSGVVRFDQKNNICFKVETHNHPSSLEPYGGASTGIGGVIRDILGTGSGAKPFASIDVFCFADWRIPYASVPQGLLHPKRIINGVVSGVRDYGNRMGIPTVAGAVLFDQRFLGNPLVYCGTLGILPKEKSFKKVNHGDLVVICGARTGCDGIHGATFSSKELDQDTVSLTSAVQIGNAIEEKKLTEAILRARDENLFNAITDCGAGGFSSAISELAKGYGLEVELSKVPLKYKGISYTDIWISESQERMVFFARQENLKRLEEIFSEEDVDLTVVGNVTDTNKVVLKYQGNVVCDLDMDFLFTLPQLKKKAVWVNKKEVKCSLPEKENYNQEVLSVISSLNVASKDWVLRQYDHEVQAGAIRRGIDGIETLRVSDVTIVRPDLKSDKAVAIGLGINPFYSDLDPYWMSALAIDEALRNLVCSGAQLNKTFILDNFSWASPSDPKILGALVRSAKACYDFSKYYGVPFISGKDSLYNEYTVGDKRIVIPSTLLISAMAVLEDYKSGVQSHFQKQGNFVYLVGKTKAELGASEYFRLLKKETGIVPKVDKEIAKPILEKMAKAVRQGFVVSCHDLSEGGVAVALAEMAIGSKKGAAIFLGEIAKGEKLLDYEIMFSESATRFVVEVEKDKQKIFENEFEGLPLSLIGCVNGDSVVIHSGEGKEIVNLEIGQLTKAWQSPFDEFRYRGGHG